MNNDCYFWIDNQVPEEERIMNVMCVDCHVDSQHDSGWFWEGSKKGYGPYEYKCDKCGKIIHAAPTT
jgi:hypothetical protein